MTFTLMLESVWSLFSSHPLSLSIGLLLFKATLLLLAALAASLLVRRASAGTRHLVWLVALGGLLLLPALAAWGPLPLRILPAPAAPVTIVSEGGTTVPLRAFDEAVRSQAQAQRDLDAARHDAAIPDENANTPVTPAADSTALSGIGLGTMVAGLWFAVVLVLAAWLMHGWYAVGRIVRRAEPLVAPEWQGPLYEIADRLGLDTAPRLLRSTDVHMPFACGLARTTIVLPAESDQWSEDQRAAVLIHELGHVRRHDLIGHTLGRVACVLYWFHPLVWTAARRLRDESERACDDLALAFGTRPSAYAEHLLDIVTTVRHHATPSVALAMAHRKEFEGRMLAILDPQLRRVGPSRRKTASLVTVLVLFSAVVGAAAPAPRQGTPVPPTSAVSPTPPTSPTSPASAGEPNRLAQRQALPETPKLMEPYAPYDAHQRVEPAYPPRTPMDPLAPLPPQDALLPWAMKLAANSLTDLGIQLGAIDYSAIAEQYDKGEKGDKGGKGRDAARARADSRGAMLQQIIDTTDEDDRPAILARVLMNDSSAVVRRVAAWGLEPYTDQMVAFGALRLALANDVDAEVRQMAAWAMGSGGETSSIVPLTLGITDRVENVREMSAWALGEIGDVGHEQGALKEMGDRLRIEKSPRVRGTLAWALGQLAPNSAPAGLIAAVSDSSTDVRLKAAWALGEIGDKAALPALRAMIVKEQDQNVIRAQLRALVAADEAPEKLEPLLTSKHPEVRAMAIRALTGAGNMGPWPWPWPRPMPFP